MRILAINKSHFAGPLRAQGHEVLVACRPEEQNRERTDTWSLTGWDITYRRGDTLRGLLARLPRGFLPDRIVYFDESSMIFALRGLEEAPCPTVFYSVDAHVHCLWHPQMSGVFDGVFVAQMDHIPRFERFCPSVEWLPLWAPVIAEPSGRKEIEVCFRGNLTGEARAKRAEFVAALAKEVPLDFGTGPYLEDFRRSKIVLNESIGGDVNFRVFEALGTGALLLTQRVGNGLLELFRDGQDLVTYEPHDVADAARKIRNLLGNDAERERIAASGHALVQREHSEAARAARFLQLLETVERSPRRCAPFSVAYAAVFEISRRKDLSEAEQRAACAIASDALRKHAKTGLAAEVEAPLMLLHLCKLLRRFGTAEEILPLVKDCALGWPKEFPIGLVAFYELERLGAAAEARAVAQRMGVPEGSLREHAPRLVAELERSSFFDY